jgi:hypothetical protein
MLGDALISVSTVCDAAVADQGVLAASKLTVTVLKAKRVLKAKGVLKAIECSKRQRVLTSNEFSQPEAFIKRISCSQGVFKVRECTIKVLTARECSQHASAQGCSECSRQ